MTPGLFAYHKLASKLAPSTAHQEKLDTHFSTDGTGKWRSFKKNLRAKSFVAAVQQDDRADDKLKRFAAAVGEYTSSKDHGVPVKGSEGKTYYVKYLPQVGRYGCNCGHWTHDLSHLARASDCKHIASVRSSMEKSGSLGQYVGAYSATRRFQDSTAHAKITADAGKRHLTPTPLLPHPISDIREHIRSSLV